VKVADYLAIYFDKVAANQNDIELPAEDPPPPVGPLFLYGPPPDA
jgi:hypothetical protein